MKLTIIGASAGVGLATAKRALELGHTVTTLARRKVEIKPNENLTTIQGDALHEDDLKSAISGADAILVTLGTGMKTSATTLCSDFAKVLLDIHACEPITVPVIILSGFGAGDSRPYLWWLSRPVFSLILNKIYVDKVEMEQRIAASTLRWEFVRPGTLTNKPLTGKYRVEPTLYTGMNIRKISRADVADYLVKEAVALKNLGKYPALTEK